MKQAGRLVMMVTLVAAGWGALSCDAAPAAVSAFVSILPQAGFLDRLGGDRVRVEVLVPPGQSPATYTATAAQMARLSEAQVYFRIGVPFENVLLPKLTRSVKTVRIVDTRRGITLRRMAHHHHHDGDGHGHDEPEAGADPHIWLSPELVVRQAKTMVEALVDIDPEGAPVYRANLQAFTGELKAVHGRLLETFRPLKGKTLMVFHPAWGYFADAYGLRQEAIEIEGKTPSAKQLGRVMDQAKREGVKVIFVQQQFDQRCARAVASSIGGAVVALDPLAKDYLPNLERIATEVKRALSQE